MLDCFEILTTSGVVLWSKSYAPVGPNVINSLIKDVFIEETVPSSSLSGTDVSAGRNPPYKREKYTLRWTTAKDLGLIFVAVYQSLLHLSWIDKLLDNVKTIFTTLYRDEFKKPHTSAIECPFDEYFDRQVEELEKSAGGRPTARLEGLTPTTDLTPPSSAGGEDELHEVPSPRAAFRGGDVPTSAPQTFDDTTSAEVTPIATPDGSRPSTPSSHVITGRPGPGGRTSRRARKAAATSSASRDLSASSLGKPSGIRSSSGKVQRRWNDDGMMDEDSDIVLDYSAPASTTPSTNADAGKSNMPAPGETFGKKTGKGEVVLRDLDDEMDSILSSAAASKAADADGSSSGGYVSSGLGAISGLFRNVVGGKTLTEEDLAKPLKGMEEHLVKKNVARDAAVRLCDAVSRDLVGSKTGSFQSVDASIQASMERALTKILTPTTSLDLLRSIQSVVGSKRGASGAPQRPYVISVVGVNGVGKSTTLAKLAFLLLHNNHRVLICGADTFRSGAVEQLRVHVRNLQALTEQSPGELGQIDLYERGYGKDPAQIARDAVAHAATTGLFDIVLIDTAGRRHNDSRLMSSLEGFARLAHPDKIFMVGEALVGTDSVAQARHFNSSFGPGRGLDGFIVSKCDTVGEMVGTVVSLVFATNVPVIAVGVGQHYGDLRTLNVKWAMKLLMQ